ncbi:ATP-binding cassette domain-containing protein [Dongia rigui]|uniref:ATP-binding cassette domain-containing protein n=1 Tax=Dongia rigui TaxID=940149 RepID=A0ABU5E0J5_9PROT|nr:ATP-binding cassette domain-containing protein [Dongia rigui]MDY0872797.1 ATP-binding cassette domain-containing protein [Dongia rigui]
MKGPLALRSVTLFKDGVALLGPIDCTIAAGRPVVLMGPSGSGKSTLLNFMIGALAPVFGATGEVWLGDVEITQLPIQQRHLGILFQDDLLFPHLSVAENLAFGLPAGLSRLEREQRVAAGLAEAELTGLGARNPASLSGGERARAALMRTLLAEPCALLLDEPFAKLDIALRGRFRALVFERAARRNLPVLLVSHDPADAEAAAGQVIAL